MRWQKFCMAKHYILHIYKRIMLASKYLAVMIKCVFIITLFLYEIMSFTRNVVQNINKYEDNQSTKTSAKSFICLFVNDVYA